MQAISSGLVLETPTCSVTHGRGDRVCGPTTVAMNDNEYPAPPLLLFAVNFTELDCLREPHRFMFCRQLCRTGFGRGYQTAGASHDRRVSPHERGASRSVFAGMAAHCLYRRIGLKLNVFHTSDE